MSGPFLFAAAFLASAIEAVEMMAIVLGVGVTRGWRSTLIGAAVGVIVLAGIVIALGAALTSIPIAWLRLVVGALLLIFGLQWLRKGLIRIGLPPVHRPADEEDEAGGPAVTTRAGMDWYAFVIAFKGVVLEGLEVAFIVVTFGAEAHRIGLAAVAAAAALVAVIAIGVAVRGLLARIPREWLRFAVGILLTTFGTFWAAEGAGVEWPLGDATILVLLGVVGAAAFAYLETLKSMRLGARRVRREES